MNMLSPNAHGTEFRMFQERAVASETAAERPVDARPRRLKYVLAAVAIGAAGYAAVTTLSPTALWVLGGACAALAVLATAVCSYVLANTIDLI